MAKIKKLTAWPLNEALKNSKQTLKGFLRSQGFEANALTDFVDSDLMLIDDVLHYRTTMYTDRQIPLEGKHVGISLEDHIQTVHHGNRTLFAQAHSEHQTFLVYALNNNAVWLEGDVFQRIPTVPSWDATFLTKHIEKTCDGNNTAFARVCQMTQQQMHRWVSRDCYFCRGDIYLRRTALGKSVKTPDHPKAVFLDDHIRETYGPGNDGILLFSQEHKLNPQQVKRYLSYQSLWIAGQVYKNQSEFEKNGITLDYRLVHTD